MSGQKKSRGWRRLDSLARPRWAAIITCAFVSLLVSALFTAVQVPVPRVHDEFSYLLAADTFATGRLTNPTHPMWEHFESFHTIQQPSYASKYQPGQGLILALGTIVGGHPIVGAWIASALAAAAVCWMLQGWLPSRWALLGGLLVAVHGMIQVRWALSYWGGSLPMAGGALMFGALPRIQRCPSVSAALLMAMGAILLAATRPFEGLVVGLCVSVALVWWMFGRQRPNWTIITTRVVLPSALILAVGIVGLGYYNWQVTGSPWRMPYQVHEAEYGYSPLFLWQSPKAEPTYRHQVMQKLQTGWAIEDYQQQQTFFGLLKAKARSLRDLWQFFLCDALWVPLLMLKPLLARPQLKFAWATLAVFLTAQMAVPWMYPHYFAPAAPLLFLLVIYGLRYLAFLPRKNYAWARVVLPAIVLIHLGTLSVLFFKYVAWEPAGWEWSRARLAEKLEQATGKHLVLVNYRPDHNGHAEWVYNRADIDEAKIVWARPMEPAKTALLLEYFSDRQVWHVDGDAEHPELIAGEESPRANALSAIGR